MTIRSPNFDFLAPHTAVLQGRAAEAERLFADDPDLCLLHLRFFVESLAHATAAHTGCWGGIETTFVSTLNSLQAIGALSQDAHELFQSVHCQPHASLGSHSDRPREALHRLIDSHRLAVWFHMSFGQTTTQNDSFAPPPAPTGATRALQEELDTLRVAYRSLNEEHAYTEETQGTSAEWAAVLLRSARTDEEFRAARAACNERLSDIHSQVAAQPESAVAAITSAAQACSILALDEAQARKRTEAQLRAAGWEADSAVWHWSKGARPAKGRNVAIAGWSGEGVPVDYVLFAELVPLAVVRVQLGSDDLRASLYKAREWSQGIAEQSLPSPLAPWVEHQIPLLFATNSRSLSTRGEENSGVWLLDVRSSTQCARALSGWYSPADLVRNLPHDGVEHEARLKEESMSPPRLRSYQQRAISAVENELGEGKRGALIEMAPGTGKSRTAVALVYRLLKTRRFRRVLFLVSGGLLATRAADAFSSVPVEGHQALTELFKVKTLSHLEHGDLGEAQVHISTLKEILGHLFHPAGDARSLSVGAYDCVVVDECRPEYLADDDPNVYGRATKPQDSYLNNYRRVLNYLDAVRVGLTSTPTQHTTEFFGRPVFKYTYREAVLDGHLVDQEPPIRIVTGLAQDGVYWVAHERMASYRPHTRSPDPTTAPDRVRVDVALFDRRVRSQSFNQVVCEELAREIDLRQPGKTLVFCSSEDHADNVVQLLRAAFETKSAPVPDGTVMKITRTVSQPMELLLRFQDESDPLKVVVTVDLLTTGINVPAVCNLVFIRRMESRTLFEQMKGRALRRCDEIGKEVFRIFDAVDIVAPFAPWDQMQPVLSDPQTTFQQLVSELGQGLDARTQRELHEQLVAKLQRKKRLLTGELADQFQALARTSPVSAVQLIRGQTPAETVQWFDDRPGLGAHLDRSTGDGRLILVSEFEDDLRRTERGDITLKEPSDYMESFGRWLKAQRSSVPELELAITSPSSLTRENLRTLCAALAKAGYPERNLRVASQVSTGKYIAAGIVGFIRERELGIPLTAHAKQIDAALAPILERQSWTPAQRTWLETIAAEFKSQGVLDLSAIEMGEFGERDGLEEILQELNDYVWGEGSHADH